MKCKVEIKGIKLSCDGNGNEYFDSFRCSDSSGKCFLIDAIVSGCFSDEIDDMTAEEEIEWAKEKIGKYLFFDDLSAVSYVAIGKVYIV